eukprot:541605_1
MASCHNEKTEVKDTIVLKIVYCDDKTGEIDFNNFEEKECLFDQTLKSLANDIENILCPPVTLTEALKSMGFELKSITRALKKSNNDMYNAVRILTGNETNQFGSKLFALKMKQAILNHQNNTPLIHFWLKFGQIKSIYPLNKRVTVTEDDLKNENIERWVEVPDDYLEKLSLNTIFKENNIKQNDKGSELLIFGYIKFECNNILPMELTKEILKYYRINCIIVVEKKQKKYNNINIWPRAKGNEWRSNLQVGDIVDIQDSQDKWYEGLIRAIYPSTNEFVFHLIGWNIQWAEKLSLDTKRMDKRHTHTDRPRRTYAKYDW